MSESDFDSDDSVKDPDYNRVTLSQASESSGDVIQSFAESVAPHKLIDKEVKSKFAAFFDFKTISKDNKVAACILCKERKVKIEFKVKTSSTTSLKRHLQQKHQKEYETLYPNQPGTSTSSSGSGTLYRFFSSTTKAKIPAITEVTDDCFVDWIAIKYLPFSFFDDEATHKFFKSIQPGIKLPGRKTLKKMVLSRFNYLQNMVMKILEQNKSKISFTVDGWTAINGKSYYGITAHFVDNNWELQSIVIDFVPSHGQHSGKAIAKLFFDSLQKYEIQSRIQGITVDNTAANTSFMQELKLLLPNFDDINQHFRCMAHILNLSAQAMLATLNLNSTEDENEIESEHSGNDETDFDTGEIENPTNSITKVRGLFKKIKRSEQLRNRFKSACEAAGAPTGITPILDVATRWNSTHDMLEVALKLKKGFVCLCSSDFSLKLFNLSENEWQIIESVVKFLKVYKKVSELLGGDKYVTLPSVILGINMLIDKIEATTKTLNDKIDRSAIDEQLLIAFQAARDKLLKHYRLTNWIYCAVLVLDPRHKMEIFDRTVWGRALKQESYSTFKNLFQQYELKNKTTEIFPSFESLDSDEEDFDINSLYKSKRQKVDDLQTNSELSNYLNLPRCDGRQDILKWWKNQEEQYPVLAQMARDFFSITATSVPAERLFSKAGLVIRKQRNRLSNESAKILLCLNSWVGSPVLKSFDL